MTAKLYDIPLTRIDGATETVGDYDGKVLLVINVASKCGLTPQYEGLEALYRAKASEGLEILGFPSNEFAGQEPGTEAEIADFCSTTYDVTFPIFAKTTVHGAQAHPLYQALTGAHLAAVGDGPMREKLKAYGIEAGPPAAVVWNFEKYLIGRDGKLVARIAPDVTPDDPRLVELVEAELAKPT